MIMIVFACVCIIIHRYMHYISILYAHMIMVALCAYGECGFWCSTLIEISGLVTFQHLEHKHTLRSKMYYSNAHKIPTHNNKNTKCVLEV